jgi:hypothetical protein
VNYGVGVVGRCHLRVGRVIVESIMLVSMCSHTPMGALWKLPLHLLSAPVSLWCSAQSSVMLANLMIEWDELVVKQPIGSGGQGTVYKGRWRVSVVPGINGDCCCGSCSFAHHSMRKTLLMPSWLQVASQGRVGFDVVHCCHRFAGPPCGNQGVRCGAPGHPPPLWAVPGVFDSLVLQNHCCLKPGAWRTTQCQSTDVNPFAYAGPITRHRRR